MADSNKLDYPAPPSLPTMASSRIFIKGLPPAISENDFKKHFGAKHEITDSKLISQRRIGYVGYKTPEDAAKAVKYFNRSFIRMSKITVEIARPVCTTWPLNLPATNASRYPMPLYPSRGKCSESRNVKMPRRNGKHKRRPNRTKSLPLARRGNEAMWTRQILS
jgi:RNA recognition motif-containing protein